MCPAKVGSQDVFIFVLNRWGGWIVTGIGGADGYPITVTASECLFSAFGNISQVFCAEQRSIAGEPEQPFLFIALIPLHY